jgi:hypothetical protein
MSDLQLVPKATPLLSIGLCHKIPQIEIHLSWWRRFQIACGILFSGRAKLPEMEQPS